MPRGSPRHRRDSSSSCPRSCISWLLYFVAHTNTEFHPPARTGRAPEELLRLHAALPRMAAERRSAIDPRRVIGKTHCDGLPRVAAGKQDLSHEFRAKDLVTARRPDRI